MIRSMLIPLLFSSISMAQSTGILIGKPTMYHTPVIKLAEMTCLTADRSDKLKPVYNKEGEIITQLCPVESRQCNLEGACMLEDATGKRMTMTVYRYDKVNDRNMFSMHPPGRCPFGYGFGFDKNGKGRETCLDPYFSVATDSTVHRLGEVLFIPKLVGVKLPTGEIHDGYVIVREAGIGLRGAGFERYVFFTGNESDADVENNPFTQKSLDIYDYDFRYQIVSEEKAIEVRKKRNYPNVNEIVRKAAQR